MVWPHLENHVQYWSLCHQEDTVELEGTPKKDNQNHQGVNEPFLQGT